MKTILTIAAVMMLALTTWADLAATNQAYSDGWIYITNEPPRLEFPVVKSHLRVVEMRMDWIETRLKHLERSTAWLWTITGGILMVMAMAGIARCRK